MKNRYEINEPIPGIDTDDDISFSRWLELARADYHKWVSEALLNKPAPKCHLALAVRAYDSRMVLSKNPEMHMTSDYYFLNKDMVKQMNSYYSENLWNNLHILESIPYCNKIISVYGGIIRFTAKFNAHEKHNSKAFRSTVLNELFHRWPEGKEVPRIFDSEEHFSEDHDRIFECDFELLSKMIQKTKHEEDKLIWAKEMAFRYITKQIKLTKDQLSLVSSIIKGKNFHNLITDNLFITYKRGMTSFIKENISSSDEDIFSAFGYKNKDLKRALFSKACISFEDDREITTLDLSVMALLPRIKDIKHQQTLVKIVNDYDSSHPQIDSIEEICESMKHLNLFSSDNQRINFIVSCLNADATTIQDTQAMLQTLSLYRYPTYEPSVFLLDFMNNFRGKLTNIVKIHNWLAMHVINKNSIKFNQEKLATLEGLTFNKRYTLHVPSHNNELIEAGAKMMICVGNGAYLDSILQKRSMILLINDEEGSPQFCVQVGYDLKVIQAQGIKNKPMTDKTLSDLVYILETKLQNRNKFMAFTKKAMNKYFLYGNIIGIGLLIMLLFSGLPSQVVSWLGIISE